MSNNSSGKNFLLLLLGIGMLGVGLFLFFSRISLTTGHQLWGYFGDRNFLGMLFIPFILGIVLWVLFSKNIWPKILTWVSVVAMVICVISSLRFRYTYDAFSTIMMVILIFVGGALTLKKLYIDSPKRAKNNEDKDDDMNVN